MKKQREYEVWFVDDLTKNLRDFEKNHSGDFKVIRTFKKTSEVLSLIHQKNYPDALLVDVFFYPTEEEAQRAEDEVADLANQLRTKAANLGLADHTLTARITLMKEIYRHFGKKPPEFPMYAYTSKGPFLLEQKDWRNISTYGAQVLLKGRVSPEIEARLPQEDSPSAAEQDSGLRHDPGGGPQPIRVGPIIDGARGCVLHRARRRRAQRLLAIDTSQWAFDQSRKSLPSTQFEVGGLVRDGHQQ